MTTRPDSSAAPPWLRFIRRYVWLLSGLLGMVTLCALRPLTRHIPDPPEVSATLPAFDLLDHNGQPFNAYALRGHTWVAGFVFTRCTTTCPMVTAAMKQLHERFTRMQYDIALVSLSVDPSHDTPQVLANHAQAWRVQDENWRFVTGREQAMRALVEGGFRLGMGQPQTQDGGMMDIAHATKLALVDGRGRVRGFYGTDTEGLDELFERTTHVLANERRQAFGLGPVLSMVAHRALARVREHA